MEIQFRSQCHIFHFGTHTQAANPSAYAIFGTSALNRVLTLPDYSGGPELSKSYRTIDLENTKMNVGCKTTFLLLDVGPNVIYFVVGHYCIFLKELTDGKN